MHLEKKDIFPEVFNRIVCHSAAAERECLLTSGFWPFCKKHSDLSLKQKNFLKIVCSKRSPYIWQKQTLFALFFYWPACATEPSFAMFPCPSSPGAATSGALRCEGAERPLSALIKRLKENAKWNFPQQLRDFSPQITRKPFVRTPPPSP